jgi:fused signal recognition particle receptor
MAFNWFRRQFDESEKGKKDEQKAPPKLDQSQSEVAQSEVTESAEVKTPAVDPAQDLLNWAKAAYSNIQQREVVQPTVEIPEMQPVVESESVAIANPQELEAPAQPEEPEAQAELIVTSAELDLGAEELVEAIASELVDIQVETLEQEVQTEEEQPQIEAIAEPEPQPELVEIVVEPVTEAIAEPEPQPETIPEPEPVTEQVEVTESEPESQPEVIEAIAEIIAEPATEVAEEIVEIEPDGQPEELPFWLQSDSDRQARIAALAATAIEDAQPTPPAVKIETAPEVEFVYTLDEGFLWSAEILRSQGRRPEDISVEEITWLKQLRQSLDKTRLSLVNQLKALVGQGPINAEAVEEIEAILLQADVGVKATDEIIKSLQDKLRTEVLPPDEAIAYLKQILRQMLDAPISNHNFASTLVPEKNQLNIWLVTGVNGAGKTTTIGKIAHLAKKSGYSTLIAAADTFRAAAVQQVKVWGDRAGVDVIANQGKNTDPAAVVFDGITAAQSRGTELLLVDTAGRLQNKQNLMEELSKIRRIVDKKSAGAIVESLLVLDATLGQNGLRQAEVFSKSAGISGVVLTKLDGTAKGGVAIAVVQQLGLPIRFIGAGEGLEDLRPFSSFEFVEALLSN